VDQIFAPSKPAVWYRRNRLALLAMTILLLGAALFGHLARAAGGLPSAATAYNLFHLLAGLVGVGVLVSSRRHPRGAAVFNAGFGLVDLYQAIAGIVGWAPARLFELRPADHVVHVVLGIALLAVALPLVRPRAYQGDGRW
jgi:hypothetical protein